MTEYNFDLVHRAIGEAYTMTKDIKNPDMQESMKTGLVRLAHQARAAEELQTTDLSELAEAIEYGSEGMGDIYVTRGAANKQAEEYREIFADIISGQGNPIQSATTVEKQAEQALQMAQKGVKPYQDSEQLNKNINQLEELQKHLEYGEQAQRDAVRGNQIAEEAATAYGASLGVLVNENEALERQHLSNLRNEDEDAKLAAIAVQELNPQEL